MLQKANMTHLSVMKQLIYSYISRKLKTNKTLSLINKVTNGMTIIDSNDYISIYI